MRLYIH